MLTVPSNYFISNLTNLDWPLEVRRYVMQIPILQIEDCVQDVSASFFVLSYHGGTL
jgi:hypothetical protein